MARCHYHRCWFTLDDGECPACRRDGLEVVVCEIDKIGRVVDSMGQDGQRLQPHSFAVLAFNKRKKDGNTGTTTDAKDEGDQPQGTGGTEQVALFG